MNRTPGALDAALCAERVRRHGAILTGSMAASAVMGLGLVAAVWGSASTRLGLAWLGCLLLVLGARLLVGWRQARDGMAADHNPAWLRRHRIGFAAHGAIWAVGSLLLLAQADQQQASYLAFGLIAMAAGSLILTAFDVTASLLFVGLALAPLLLHLLRRNDAQSASMFVMVALLLAAAVAAALRTQRLIRESVRLRLDLAEKHYLLPILLANTKQGYWYIDREGLTKDVNPAMCELLGRSREQLVGRSVYDFFTGADLEVLVAQVEARRRGAVGGYEIGLTRPDGTRRYCQNNATPVRDAQGSLIGSIGLWTDISTRRAAEMELRTYELAINSIGDLVSVVNEDLVYVMVNDAWCRHSGYRREDVVGRPARDFLPADANLERQGALHACLQQQRVQVVRDAITMPGLLGRRVETAYYPHAQPDGTARSVVMVTRDITAEEQALALVKDNEAQQRALIEAFPGFIARLDHKLVYTHVNQRLAKRLGSAPENIIGHSFSELFGEVREAELRGLIQRAQAGEEVSYERVHDAPGSAGQTDKVTLATGIDPNTGETLIYSFGIDITALKLAEQRLRTASEELTRTSRALQLTLDNIDQGIVSVDAEGRAGVYNRRLLELLDIPEYLLGPESNYDAVVRYQAQQGDLEADHGFIDVDGQRRFFKGGRINSPDLYVRRTRNGTVLEVRTRKLSDGGLVRTFANVTDYFDAQQSLRDSEAETRALLSAFPGSIVAINHDLMFVYVNEVHASLLGVPPSSLVGRHLREVLGEERFRFSLALITRTQAQGAATQEVHYPAEQGRARRDIAFTFVAGPKRSDGKQTLYGFGQDITARKHAEEALVAARDAAESASRAKSDFLASMSHELRTPLNAILGFSQLLAADAQLPEATRGDAREIERAGMHLLTLVNDMIDLARIESGKLEIELAPVAPVPLILQCLDMVAPLARKQGVEVRTSDSAGPLMVLADLVRLRQVLINLMSNAIKYNRAQGWIHVNSERHGEYLRINVSDNGIGIAAENRARVFNAFDRLGAERGRVEGAGIGLVITKRIVEAMGASIAFESQPGVGTRFWIDLPLAAADNNAARKHEATPGIVAVAPDRTPTAMRSTRARVLYVEDNLINATIMQRVLRSLPQVDLDIVETAEAALEHIRHQPPDLILMDVHLPGISGVDAVRLLKADPRTAHIPVVAVSAAAMAGDIEHGLAAGFRSYLTKPFNVPHLLATVADALEDADRVREVAP